MILLALQYCRWKLGENPAQSRCRDKGAMNITTCLITGKGSNALIFESEYFCFIDNFIFTSDKNKVECKLISYIYRIREPSLNRLFF